MTNLKIEKLTNEYVQKVFELETQLIGKASRDSIEKTLSNETLSYYVLLNENVVVGFFECLIIAPEAELFDIAVKDEFQGKGYSKILMDYFLNLAKQASCDTVFLEVNSINHKALNLYRKYGFVQFDVRKKYYGDNDAILMKLELN